LLFIKKIVLFKQKITNIYIMEINYDLIIKYLVTQKKTHFSSKKHILVYSDLFPEKFKNILQNKFYRYGVNQYDTFYSTILTLLNKIFITNNNDEEIIEINKFKKSLVKTLNNFELLSYLVDIIDKQMVFNKVNEFHIQVISEILSINFIIFNFKNESINVIYTGELCNPYKPTLLIANYDDFYEPIICETDNKKIFSCNDLIVKKIYYGNITVYTSLNKVLKFQDSLYDFEDKPLIETNEVFTKEESQPILQVNESEYTFAKLNKMVKKDLEEILNKKKIKYLSRMLKKDLIELILG